MRGEVFCACGNCPCSWPRSGGGARRSALEAARAKGEHQRVAMARARVERLDRRGLVDHARIVEQQRRSTARRIVKRRPVGPSASKTRVSPPLMPARDDQDTATRSTPSRCAPSGVGRPMPPAVSMRNWCASTYHGCAPRRRDGAAGQRRAAASASAVAATTRAAHRLEPALDAAVQRVVFDAAASAARCGACVDRVAAHDEARVAAAAVVAAVAQVARRAAGRPSDGASASSSASARSHQRGEAGAASSTAWPVARASAACDIGRGGVERRGERRPSLTGVALGAPAPRPSPAPRAWPRRPRGRIGARPQLVQAIRRSRGTKRSASADGLGDLLGRLDRVAGDIDHADHHVLAVEQAHQVGRHVRVDALERDLVDRALRERRKHLLVLAPLVAERRLPVDVGLDAVAVADVHGRLAGQALRRRARARRRPSRPRRPCRR